MTQAVHAIAPPHGMRLSRRSLLAARNVARVVARKLKANVDYDLRMYEAIREYLVRFDCFLICNPCRESRPLPSGEGATPPILIFCDALFASAGVPEFARRSVS